MQMESFHTPYNMHGVINTLCKCCEWTCKKLATKQKGLYKMYNTCILDRTVPTQLAGLNHTEQGRALCVLERALPTEAAQLAWLNHTEQGRALCVLERALPTEAAQLAGLNHSYRARQSTLCSREGSTN